MKVVTGLFEPDDIKVALQRLLENGCSHDDFSLMSSAADMPEYLAGDPEDAAVSGSVIGAVTGGALGALGTVVAGSTIPGFESMVVSGVIATAAGSVLGGFLGSLYSVRTESQTKIDIHEALESGQILLIVTGDDQSAPRIASIMTNSRGLNVEIHTITSNNQAI